MVSINDIPDFPGLPGQRPAPGAPTDVEPVAVVLVTSPLDSDGAATPLNAAAVDTFITAEISAGRAHQTTVERWNPWTSLQLPLAFSVAQKYNYARFTLKDGSHWYAYLSASYLNLTATLFTVTPDDCTTYPYTIGYSHVRRGHVAVAASQDDAYGDQYMTTPEPIDAPPATAALSASLFSNNPSSWRVVVVSANDLRGAGSFPFFEFHVNDDLIDGAADSATDATKNKAGLPQADILEADYPWSSNAGSGGHSQFFVPKVTPSPVSTIDGVAAGGGVYVFTLEGWAAYETIMQGAPWVTDGISSRFIVPSWAVGSAGSGSHTAAVPPLDPTFPAWGVAAGIPVFVSELDTGTSSTSVLNNWRNTVATSLGIGAYRKALTSQFTQIQVSDGESISEFSPEVWKSAALGFTLVTEATHGSTTIRAIPTGYSALGNQLGVPLTFGGTPGKASTGFGTAASNTAQQDMSPWLTAFSVSRGRQTLLDQQALAETLSLTNIQLNMGVQGIQAAIGAVSGAASGGAAGALGGAAQGLGSLAIATIQANNTMEMLDLTQDGSFDIATYQYGLSGIASWKTFDAWAQSLKSASGRSEGHTLAGAWRAIIGRSLDALIVTPTADGVRRLVTTWQRYGYMIERAMTPPRLDPMTAYSYWEVESPTVLGPAPADAKARIAARFERGTTVWNNVAQIGTQPSNVPRSGISY